MPRVNIPRAGDSCVVFYDPSDPQNKNGITFDQVPGFSPTATSASAPAASGPEGDGDPLAKIEKLGELRDKGLITEAEFQIQKQRLLREV